MELLIKFQVFVILALLPLIVQCASIDTTTTANFQENATPDDQPTGSNPSTSQFVLQNLLKATFAAEAGKTRPGKKFAPPGWKSVSLAPNASCGDTVEVGDNSRFEIQSQGFPNDAPVGSCIWQFIVSPLTNVDIMCKSIFDNCAAGNGLTLAVGSETGSVCYNGPLVNQRIMLKPQKTSYQLSLSHVVKGGPGAYLSCTVIGLGGQRIDRNSSFPRPADRIVGGINVAETQYPFMVQVWTAYGSCGGTILNANWVLTAAHCVYNVGSTGVWVYAGCSTETWCSESSQSIAYYLGGGYVHGAFPYNYDIALVELQTPLNLNSYSVAAVQLASPYLPIPASMSIVGWGMTTDAGEGGPLSNSLKEANVTTLNANYGITLIEISSSLGYAGGWACYGDSGGFVGTTTIQSHQTSGGFYPTYSYYTVYTQYCIDVGIAPGALCSQSADFCTSLPGYYNSIVSFI